MRANEKRLLMVALFILVALGALILSQHLLQWQKRLDRQERDIELAQLEANALLADKTIVEQQNLWLTQHIPHSENPLEANLELESAERTAKELGLSVTNKQLLEPYNTAYYDQIGFSMELKGDLYSLFQWMYQLLSPENFRSIPTLKLTPDKDNPQRVSAKLEVLRWYSSLQKQNSNGEDAVR